AVNLLAGIGYSSVHIPERQKGTIPKTFKFIRGLILPKIEDIRRKCHISYPIELNIHRKLVSYDSIDKIFPELTSHILFSPKTKHIAFGIAVQTAIKMLDFCAKKQPMYLKSPLWAPLTSDFPHSIQDTHSSSSSSSSSRQHVDNDFVDIFGDYGTGCIKFIPKSTVTPQILKQRLDFNLSISCHSVEKTFLALCFCESSSFIRQVLDVHYSRV
ncbi:hypothetical protein ADUPG1_001706, partial [Aduncisulcus paluster]